MDSLVGHNAVLCSHGDVIPAVMNRLMWAGLTLDSRFYCSKASVWEVGVESGRFITGPLCQAPQTLIACAVPLAKRAELHHASGLGARRPVGIEVGVHPQLPDQLSMMASLHHPALVENKDLVGTLSSGKAGEQ